MRVKSTRMYCFVCEIDPNLFVERTQIYNKVENYF